MKKMSDELVDQGPEDLEGFRGFFYSFRNSVETFVNENPHANKIFLSVEELVKLPRMKLLYIAFGVIVLFIIIGPGGRVLVKVVGVFYPLYSSILAIDSSSLARHRKWLIYWVVFIVCEFMESFLSPLFRWVPFYSLFRLLILLWIMAPTKNNGAYIIYHTFIRPAVLSRRRNSNAAEETQVVAALAQAQQVMLETETEVKNAAKEAAQEYTREALDITRSSNTGSGQLTDLLRYKDE